MLVRLGCSEKPYVPQSLQKNLKFDMFLSDLITNLLIHDHKGLIKLLGIPIVFERRTLCGIPSISINLSIISRIANY